MIMDSEYNADKGCINKEADKIPIKDITWTDGDFDENYIDYLKRHGLKEFERLLKRTISFI